MSTNSKTVEGIYRNGKVELFETPSNVDDAPVLVTFFPEGAVSLAKHDIDELQASSLRARLNAFADDWDLPEMGVYDAL